MKKRNNTSSQDIFKKITKVSLVIYCLISIAAFIVFITLSACLKNYTYMWGFLLCLGPGIVFMIISTVFPFEKIVEKGMSKGMIAWFVVAYIIKYALIFCIPIIGIKFNTNFNRWSMLATTLIAPLVVIVCKIIIANIVSKNNKNSEEKPKNTIKF